MSRVMLGVRPDSARPHVLSWTESFNIRPGALTGLNSVDIWICFSTLLVDKMEKLKYQEGQVGGWVTSPMVAFQRRLLVNCSVHG